MPIQRRVLCCCLLSLLAEPAPGAASDEPISADFWVAPDGRDTWPGTRERPFATLSHARDAVRARIASGLDADVRVLLRGGTYRVSEPLVFGPADSGTTERSVAYAAFPGETPVLSGGRSISGWRRGESGALEATIQDVAGGAWRFRELFIGGERRPRARYPDDGYLRIEKAGPDDRTSFTYQADDLQAWPDVGQVELVFLHDWSISRVPLSSVDETTRTVTLAAPVGPASRHFAMSWFEPQPRYFLENSAAFLDNAGEWHLDTQSGHLRYLPLPGESPEMLEKVGAIAPVAGQVLAVRGEPGRPVRNLHFVGIAVEHAAWLPEKGGYAAGQAGFHEQRSGEGGALREPMPAAVRFEMAEDCSFEAGRIAHVGRSALWFGRQCRGCRLVRTLITDIGGNGVMVGEDQRRHVDGKPWWRGAPQEVASGNVIEDCVIERCGKLFFGCVGVWVGIARNMRVTHNTIRELPYTGVSVGWMWSPTPTPCKGNVVEGNHIHHVMQVLSDGGGIYTLGWQPGTALRGNLIHDVPRNAGRAESNGMFLDEGTTDLVIEGNLIYATDRSPLRFHRATRNLVRGNILVVPEGAPVVRYNNTKEEDIRQEGNEVLAVAPAEAIERFQGRVGPRSAPTQSD